MSNENEPRANDNTGDEPTSGPVRDPQAIIVAAAAFAGGLLGAIVGSMVT